ncbi:M14 family zinc carboxypeptidase [Thermodesulfobacteriota bacterium]
MRRSTAFRVFLFSSALAVLCLPALGSQTAHASDLGRNMMIRAYFDKPLEGRDLADMGLDVTSFIPGSHTDVVVNFEELELITKLGYDVEVLVEDMDALIRTENSKGYYHTYPQMVSELEAIVTANPGITALYDIGDTWEKTMGQADRDIWALKISDNVGVNEDEPEILYVGAHHARERISVEVPMAFINYLLDNYGSDPVVDSLIDDRELWFVPMLNPDGNAWVAAGHDWRKNRRDNGDGTIGVDLNRNYDGCQCGDPDGNWCGTGADPYTWSETYCGSAAFSEPETQAMRDFAENVNGVTEIDGVTAAISYHSYGEIVIWSWGYTYSPTPDGDTLTRIGGQMAGTITEEDGSGTYTPHQSVYLYPTTGDFDDWFYGEQVTKPKVFSFTIELGQWFEPPVANIDQICEANREAMIYLASIAGAPSLAFKSYAINDGSGDGDGWVDPGETIVMPITLVNEGLADATGATAVIGTTSPYITVLNGNVAFQDMPSGDTGHSVSPHLAFEVDPGCPDLTQVTFQLDWAANGENGSDTFKVMVTSGELQAVLVIDDGGGQSVGTFEAALLETAFMSVVETAGGTDPATWPAYAFVIWCSGTNIDGLSSASWRSALVDYVVAGGRLLLEGGEIGYDHWDDANFAANVMHISSWYVDNSGNLQVLDGAHPVASVPNTLPATITHSYSNYGNQDAVAVRAEATAVLGWTNSSSYTSLIAYDDDADALNGGQIVYMAFDITSTDNASGQRDDILENAFFWITGDGVCPDADGDGYEADWCGGDDCDDTDPAIFPGADELCNGLDDDCDDQVPADEADADADDFLICENDCDDTNPNINPGAEERLDAGNCEDGIDNDCDTLIDGDEPQCTCPEPDYDGDGYDSEFCGGDDCDDTDPDVNPGADESFDSGNCEDGIDNDCDDMADTDPECECVDADNDGYRADWCGGTDCDDANLMVNPGMKEVRGNGIDDDCDGKVDEICFIGAAVL